MNIYIPQLMIAIKSTILLTIGIIIFSAFVSAVDYLSLQFWYIF